MASMAFTSCSLTSIQSTTNSSIVLRKSCNFTSISASPRLSQGRRNVGIRANLDDAIKKGNAAAVKGFEAAQDGAEQIRKDTVDAADNAGKNLSDLAEKITGSAEDTKSELDKTGGDAAGKVQKAAEEAWDSATDTAEKVKKSVEDNAAAAAESGKAAVKEGAEKVEKAADK